MLFDLKASMSALIWDTGQVWRLDICLGSSSSILSSSIGWSSTVSQPEHSQYSHPSGSYLKNDLNIFGVNVMVCTSYVPFWQRLLLVHASDPVIQEPRTSHHPSPTAGDLLKSPSDEAVARFTRRGQGGATWGSFAIGVYWAVFSLVGSSRFSFKRISKPRDIKE